MTIYRSNGSGQKFNCLYEQRVEVNDAKTLQQVVKYDHVCAEYKGNYRGTENFIVSDVVVMDCDNKQEPIITPEQLAKMWPDITYAVAFSRHHMKPKDGMPARPRFHVYFPVAPITDADAYARLKKSIQKQYPFFDDEALDAGRFIYGADTGDVIWHEGWLGIDYNDEWDDTEIAEGHRNSTMSRFALKVLKRYGDTEKARERFQERAESCIPPLPQRELDAVWRSALKKYDVISKDPSYVPPDEYGKPIPFNTYDHPEFPTDALPKDIAEYVAAVSESTQTPVDMAGVAALTILSVCMQGKLRIQGKSDWVEPLNTYSIVVAMPSERKSAVLHALLKPLNDYEQQTNQRNAAAVEISRMQKRVLDQKQSVLEKNVATGKAEAGELEKLAEEVADFEEAHPLKLYVDDITTERLVTELADNKGHAALISSEGGIFDTLSGTYSKTVNIDVMLKGYSGDTIRVDRIGRDSKSVMNPALSVLLMAQPDVVARALSNETFRGRGLTARFLYCVPESLVGQRSFRSAPVPETVRLCYERKIINLLEDEYGDELITLSPEADDLLAAFADELEPQLATVYADIADWAGKLVGNTLRISGLLCRAKQTRTHDFLDTGDALVVDGQTMTDAIRLARYFLVNAQIAFDSLPTSSVTNRAKLILKLIEEKKLTMIDRRKVIQFVWSIKSCDDAQPALDLLEDYGYIEAEDTPARTRAGRPPLIKYRVIL